MRQGVCDLRFCAFRIVPVVLQYKMYHPRAVGLDVTVSVAYWRVYLRPACCVLLALWWARCSTRTFGVLSCGVPSLCAMAVTVGGSGGSATWRTMPVSVGKFQYIVNIPGWWALWV